MRSRQRAADGRRVLHAVAGEAAGDEGVGPARHRTDHAVVVEAVHLVVAGPGRAHAQRLEGRDARGQRGPDHVVEQAVVDGVERRVVGVTSPRGGAPAMKPRPSGRSQTPDGSMSSGQPGRRAGDSSTKTSRFFARAPAAPARAPRPAARSRRRRRRARHRRRGGWPCASRTRVHAVAAGIEGHARRHARSVRRRPAPCGGSAACRAGPSNQPSPRRPCAPSARPSVASQGQRARSARGSSSSMSAPCARCSAWLARSARGAAALARYR